MHHFCLSSFLPKGVLFLENQSVMLIVDEVIYIQKVMNGTFSFSRGAEFKEN